MDKLMAELARVLKFSYLLNQAELITCIYMYDKDSIHIVIEERGKIILDKVIDGLNIIDKSNYNIKELSLICDTLMIYKEKYNLTIF